MIERIALALSLVAGLLSLVRSRNINRRLGRVETLLPGATRERDR
jgi:hypothetical protein